MAISNPLLMRQPRFALGAPVPKVAGTLAPGTIMFSVFLLYQSNVIPRSLLKKRASNPKSRVVMSCQVIEADTVDGVLA